MRLGYVDVVRGISVLWMVVFQLLNMFSRDFGLYSNYYWFIKYVNWFPFFMVLVGFSVKLMFDKYGKAFLSKSFLRIVKLVGSGFFLVWFVEFQVGGLFDEAISSIGLNLVVLSVLLFVFDGFKFKVYLFGFLSFLFLFLDRFSLLVGGFNPFWCLSFMFFGVVLAEIVEKDVHKPVLLMIFFFFLTLSLVGGVENVNYGVRSVNFWFLNCGLFCLVMFLAWYFRSGGRLSKAFGYFGRHSLFFYVFHFLVFRKVLLVSNSFGVFGWVASVVLVVCSVGLLVGVEMCARALLCMWWLVGWLA